MESHLSAQGCKKEELLDPTKKQISYFVCHLKSHSMSDIHSTTLCCYPIITISYTPCMSKKYIMRIWCQHWMHCISATATRLRSCVSGCISPITEYSVAGDHHHAVHAYKTTEVTCDIKPQTPILTPSLSPQLTLLTPPSPQTNSR